MYATRPLSLYRNDPRHLLESPVGTHDSGYLVITDEETKAQDVSCWGTCIDTEVRNLPFPQNKIVNLVHGDYYFDKVWFIPVLDQPLSSNRYYVIIVEGKYKGQAFSCSKKDKDMVRCCFSNDVDLKPKVLDYRDIYQQIEIFKGRYGYYAKSIAPDGFPPTLLGQKGWTVSTSSSIQSQLSEAYGLHSALRMILSEFNFPISSKRSKALIVGKWYVPFVFVKEQEPLKDQMKRSLFYQMTLEQWWEEIYSCTNDYNGNNTVGFNINVQTEVNSLFGVEALKDDDTNGLVETLWYKSVNHQGRVVSLGLSSAIVDKIKWVQKMGGWVGGKDRYVQVKRSEKFEGGKKWQRFGCFVLVERFALRRMDGTVLLACDFKHTHQIQSKWE